jgi:hypothetical protein
VSALRALPPSAAWRHVHARDGFEVVFFVGAADGVRIDGHTTAVEDGEAFAVEFTIELDDRWHTRRGQVTGRSSRGRRSVALEADGAGSWLVDGQRAPQLDGCLDLDLEASSLTNAFPVGRLRLSPGETAQAPAAYVRALDLTVDRLEQRYRRTDAGTGRERYDYAAPSFGFACELVYDESGLVLEYPGLAERVG